MDRIKSLKKGKILSNLRVSKLMFWRMSHLAAICLIATGCGGPPPVTEIAAPAKLPAEAVSPLEPPAPEDWPWWRGPEQNGTALPQSVPTTWNESENVVWTANVPGRGNSSPVIRGDHVYLTTADDAQQTQSLLSFARADGSLEWQCELHRGHFEHLHEKNSHASSTPATDGQRVFTSFLNNGAIWVSAVDASGEIAWQTEAGPFQTRHGYASSPIVYESFVIVAGDSQGASFLAALSRETGEIVWRIQRPQYSSYSSPVLAHLAGKNRLIISGCEAVTSYDPDNGDQHWVFDTNAETGAGTVLVANDLVYASGGHPETLCIRPDGSGNVTSSHLVWKNKEKIYVPSFVSHDGLLFAVNDSGIAFCWDALTGKNIWKKRLGGTVSASPLLVGDQIYLPNETGTMFVFRAARKFELLAENMLTEGGFASPAACGQQLFIRTHHQLYCLAENSP